LANILREKREVIDDFTISEGDLAFGEKQFSNFNFATDDTILTAEGVSTLGPYRFERLIAHIFKSDGYSVEIVGGAGDAGCDIVARSSKGNKLIQVKFTEISLAQGTAAINEIRGAKSTYEKKYQCKFDLVAVTNSVFSPNAHSHSISGDAVELVEGGKVQDFLLVNKVPLSILK
jgi:HJR/Mrr/RecB family endonuclease